MGCISSMRFKTEEQTYNVYTVQNLALNKNNPPNFIECRPLFKLLLT